jgi:hypothetical protein
MHWARWCGHYSACGRPVLFVRDEWYTNTYVPRYREHFGGYRNEYRGGPREVRVVERVEYRDRGDHDRREDWDHGRGHGEGHGNGHGNGHGHGHGHD